MEEVIHTTSFFECLVDAFTSAGDAQIFFELAVQRRNFGECLFEAIAIAFHAAIVPNELAQFAMEVIGRTCALDIEIALKPRLGLSFDALELGVVGAWHCLVQQRCETVANGVRQHEVAVGQTLHERARAEAVRAVVREVGLAGGIQTRNRCLQFVIHPEPAHGVVRRWVNAHRLVIGVLAGNSFVHFKQVAITLFNDVAPKAPNCIGEVEVNAVL